MHSDPDHQPPSGRPCLLWCSACGRRVTCSPEDLLRYARHGWPDCCGQVMGYLSEAGRSHPDDTEIDLPAL